MTAIFFYFVLNSSKVYEKSLNKNGAGISGDMTTPELY
jgi:hypothetical protein